MAEFTVGDVLEEDVYVTDPHGNPLAGLAPTTHEGTGPAGAIGFHVTEVGGGHYRIYSNPVALDGFYSVRVQMNDPYNQQFNISFTVDPVVSDVDILTPGDRVQLAELRRMLARRQNDYIRVVATADSSERQVIDAMNFVEDTDHFRGAEIICVTGNRNNVGQRRKIINSRYDAYQIELLSPFPSKILAGDTFDLFRVGRSGNSIAIYDAAINDAIRMAWPANREKLAATIGTYARLDQGIAIPTIFTHVYDVHAYIDDGYGWVQVPPTNHRNGRGWFVNRGDRTLGVAGGLEWVVDEKAIRLYGYGRPEELVQDTDSTSTDAEWILEMAAGELLINELDQAVYPIGQSHINRADQLRAKMVVPSEPNTVAID